MNQGRVVKYDHLGNGILYVNEKVVFIPNVIKNEVIEFKIIKDKPHWMMGKVTNIIEKSSCRMDSVCPYYSSCGGCQFMHTNYEEEISFKKNKALELLGNEYAFYKTDGLNYRNKVTLHVKNKQMGYFMDKSHVIVDIDYCYLLNDRINGVLKKLNHYIKVNDDVLENIVIRTNDKQLLLMVSGVVSNKFYYEFNEVDTIIVNNEIKKGDGHLVFKIGDYHLRISAQSFFQVNEQGLNNINNVIHEYLKDKRYRKALDLYSGVSTWGILISSFASRVISIEENKEATKDAEWNRQMNKVDNLQIINGKVEDYIDKFKDVDLIIIDPPRSGLDAKTREYLKIINPSSIIYISCDMFTLKRDLQDLSTDYKVLDVRLVDMFKRTYHVECVCLLNRR